MDLGLINHKLVNDEYEGREQFVEDLRLVFSNAVEFNRPAAQQAQSQKELNPHFVMDDLAAKTYAIATHLLNYVDHLELESFTVRQANFKLYFNLRCVVVCVRCFCLYAVACVARRSCPSLSRNQGSGAEIARRDRSHSARSEDSVASIARRARRRSPTPSTRTG